MNVSTLINNIDDILAHATMIGIGSTRKVFRYEQFVIKTFLHPIGYAQSKNEETMYQALETRDVANHIAPILHITENYVIQPFYEQLPLRSHCSYDIDLANDPRMTADLKESLRVLDEQLDGFDFKDSDNYGLDKEGNLVLIDYGMTKKLYEDKWVPLAEAGKLPQIRFEACHVCHIEKELRMYGEADTDYRCVACGKDY